MPKYTIIVPVYNCLPFLSECVQSILQQSEPDFELLLVDDGSTDGSGALCDSLAQGDSRIRVFHKANGGAASARNYGIDRATGSYLLFVDGDDTIAPDCLSKINSKLLKNTLVIFGMSFDHYRKKKLIRQEKLSCDFCGTYSMAALTADFDSFFQNNQLSSACNKVFERTLIQDQKLYFPDGMTLYEDFCFVVQYLQHSDTVSCIPEPFYHYRHDVDKPHLNQRVACIQTLQKNLSQLNRALLNLFQRFPREAILSTAANLYVGMLSQHLLQRKDLRPDRLRSELQQYCSDPSFREILSLGGKLSASSSYIVSCVHNHQISKLSCFIVRRRMKNKMKCGLKLMIRKITG